MPSTVPTIGDTTSDSSTSTMVPPTGTPSAPAPVSWDDLCQQWIRLWCGSGCTSFSCLTQVSIKSLIPYTLDVHSHNFTKWHTLYCMVLGRFNLLHHVESDDTHPKDFEWTKDNLLVVNWLYPTISENLLDMCLKLRSPTAG
jgi:hypothetical protein